MIDNRKKFTAHKRPHKFYLSDEARAILERASDLQALPMSTLVELLIRTHLRPEEQA